MALPLLPFALVGAGSLIEDKFRKRELDEKKLLKIKHKNSEEFFCLNCKKVIPAEAAEKKFCILCGKKF